jgi:hypothetical protein
VVGYAKAYEAQGIDDISHVKFRPDFTANEFIFPDMCGRSSCLYDFNLYFLEVKSKIAVGTNHSNL